MKKWCEARSINPPFDSLCLIAATALTRLRVILGGFQKNKYFLGYEDFVDIFWGHHNIGLYLGVIPCILGSFLRTLYRMGIIFWVAKFSNIFWGA